MIRALLWDNDGVIIDSEELFFEETRKAFSLLNLNLTRELWATQYLGQGKGTRFIAGSIGEADIDIDLLISERNKNYRMALRQSVPIRPQVQETLSTLHGRLIMALVTGSHRDELLLMHTDSGLLNFFDTIITADDYLHSKPDPEPYLTATAALNLAPDNCIAIEDSQRGFMAAGAAKIPCIVVPNKLTEEQDFSGALSVEDDVSGVLKYVLPELDYKSS